MRKQFYLIAAVVGTVGPWIFFARFIGAEGLDLPLFVQSLFANGAAGGFSADVLISGIVFLVWSFDDARRRAVGNWWVLVPALFLVGLSMAFPLYLYMRYDADA